MMTSTNIISHELIGLQAEIVTSSNPQIAGMSGRIVDETKFMFTLDTQKGLKKFPKASSNWKFVFTNGESMVDGSKLTKRSYERMGANA